MAKLNVRVNRKKPESMTRQIREQLNSLIDAGGLAAGTFLPSELVLANTLKVALNIVGGAYEQRLEAGKLRSEGRKGRSGRSGGGRTKKEAAMANATEQRKTTVTQVRGNRSIAEMILMVEITSSESRDSFVAKCPPRRYAG